MLYKGLISDGHIAYAATYQARQVGGLGNFKFGQKSHQYYLGTTNGKVGAAGKLSFDGVKLTSVLGVQIKEADHTWKLRLHDSGSFRALLSW